MLQQLRQRLGSSRLQEKCEERGRAGGRPLRKMRFLFFFPSFPIMGNVSVLFLLFPCTLAQSTSFPTQAAGAGKVMLYTRAHQGSVLSSLDTQHGFFLTNTKTSSSSPFGNSFRNAFLPSSLLRTALCDVTTSRSRAEHFPSPVP